MLTSIIYQLTLNEIRKRYTGSKLGPVWLILHPLSILLIFNFIFSGVFRSKWGVNNVSNDLYMPILYIGIIVVTFFNETVSRSSTILRDYRHLITKTNLDINILPVVAVLSSLAVFTINLVIWISLLMWKNVDLMQVSLIQIGLVILFLILFSVCISYITLFLSIYVADISQVVSLMTMGVMFLSPVFYPMSAMTTEVRKYLELSPLSIVIENFREIVFGVGISFNQMVTPMVILFVTTYIAYIGLKHVGKNFVDDL